MDLFENVHEVRSWVLRQRTKGEPVHLVPTMGFLHEGHLSLIRRAKAEAGHVVVSIFVNPKQFGPGEDFLVYPRDLPKDLAMANDAGADAVFAPAIPDMYPTGFQTHISVPEIASRLCGAVRPGHFDGVAVIVLKLLNIVQPDRAYFGLKDRQQLQLIARMVRDLNVPVDLVACPTVRESDGLAMSSRNSYLSKEERAQAPVIYKALQLAQKQVKAGERDAKTIEHDARKLIEREPLAKVQYLEVVDPETMERIATVHERAVIVCAVLLGKTRLIDNLLLEA